MDFARVYYFSQVIADCARTGAMYAANPDDADQTDFDCVEDATLSAASGLSPTPSVTVTEEVDGAGNDCVAVNVRYSFPLLTRYLGVPSPVTVSRTVHARLYPSAELN
jgi:hypothetical protein